MGWGNQPRGPSQPLSGEGVLYSPSDIYGLEEWHGCFEWRPGLLRGLGQSTQGSQPAPPEGEGVLYSPYNMRRGEWPHTRTSGAQHIPLLRFIWNPPPEVLYPPSQYID